MDTRSGGGELDEPHAVFVLVVRPDATPIHRDAELKSPAVWVSKGLARLQDAPKRPFQDSCFKSIDSATPITRLRLTSDQHILRGM